MGQKPSPRGGLHGDFYDGDRRITASDVKLHGLSEEWLKGNPVLYEIEQINFDDPAAPHRAARDVRRLRLAEEFGAEDGPLMNLAFIEAVEDGKHRGCC